MNNSMTFPKPLSKNEEAKYIERVNQGDNEAKQILIEHNLRLVVYISNKYQNTSYEQDDLVSIGTIGLIKAVNTFDSSKNIKFATYASRCIQNEILMFFRKNKKRKNDVYLDEVLSYDGDGNELSLVDTIGTDKEEVEEEIEGKDTFKLVIDIIDTLPKVEKEIIQFRFGIGCEKKRQSEIADLFEISQSYVSRIERKVLKKIKKEFEKKAI